MILVDTSVWSLALRRRRGAALNAAQVAVVDEWKKRSMGSDAALIGIVRQEILSGVCDSAQFDRLKRALDDFPCLSTSLEDHDVAAKSYNICRTAGVTGDPVDMLICACAIRHNVPIFTVDPDYVRYAKHLPLRLHAV
jgi:predicted nucleic acid-binding protein